MTKEVDVVSELTSDLHVPQDATGRALIPEIKGPIQVQVEWLPELKPFLDPDVYEAAGKAHLMDGDAIQLQLCREIHRLTERLDRD